MKVFDIHTHLLPGVDDGSQSINESIIELQQLRNQGVTDVFLTSHCYCLSGVEKDIHRELVNELEKQKIDINTYLGCEIYCNKDLINDCIRKIKSGYYYTMNNTRYILIEFETSRPYCDLNEMIYCVEKLVKSNYIPIIAHTERYECLNSIDDVIKLKKARALIQVNFYSFVDDKKERTIKMANEMLDNKIIDFIGSDCHSIMRRPPVVENGLSFIKNINDKEYAKKILYGNVEEMLLKNELKQFSEQIYNGMIGSIIGDALGCPVEFTSREELKNNPVGKMEGNGTFDMPAGTWTDDSSMALATLDSIKDNNGINLFDIMKRFSLWFTKGKYTPCGYAFDVGNTTLNSIIRFLKDKNVKTCGGSSVTDNGNGSLMRILPACLYCYTMQKTHGMGDDDTILNIHDISGLTHNHQRSKIACGLYYFLVRSILDEKGTLIERLQIGINNGFNYYKKDIWHLTELSYYGRLHNMYEFSKLKENDIKSGGYVVDSLEAAIWSLLNSNSFKDSLLIAVNLGNDTDTVATICGGLSGLYYGIDNIPKDWISEIQDKELIDSIIVI